MPAQLSMLHTPFFICCLIGIQVHLLLLADTLLPLVIRETCRHQIALLSVQVILRDCKIIEMFQQALEQ